MDTYDTMTDEEMRECLLQLGGMIHYQAILRYLKQRDALAVTALKSIDPFKNPTELARNQGIQMGLWDLPGGVEVLKERAKEAETGVSADDAEVPSYG